MKVALILASMSRSSGGIGLIARSLAFHLKSLGVQSTVFSLRDQFSEVDTKDWLPIPVDLSAPKAPAAFGYAPQFLPSLRQSNPSLLHVHGLWMYPGIAAREYSIKTGRPFLITIHGMLEPWALGNSRWKKKITAFLYEKKNLQSAQCIHVNTQAEMVSVRKFGLKNPVAIIPNGVFLPEHKDVVDTSTPERTLLFLGRIHPKKGIAELLQSWAVLKNKADWKLVIAGWDDGGHEAKLRSLAAELGIAGSVKFIGPLFGAEKEAVLRSASAFILPSFSEGLPMAVLEAWSYALPILMTLECNIPEGFQTQAALQIEPRTDSICEGLQSLMAMSDQERKAMGRRGLDLVKERFTWENAAGKTNHVYQWLLGNEKKPDCVTTL